MNDTDRRFLKACKMISKVAQRERRGFNPVELGRREFNSLFEMGDGRVIARRIADKYNYDPEFRSDCNQAKIKRYLSIEIWQGY